MLKLLLGNRFRTPDGTLLYSHDCHDYAAHDDANGETYFIDGGTEYIRMSINKVPMEDLCIYSDQAIEDIREALELSTHRNNIRAYVLLKDMTDDELMSAMIAYDPEVCHNDPHNMMFITLARELVYRDFEKRSDNL